MPTKFLYPIIFFLSSKGVMLLQVPFLDVKRKLSQKWLIARQLADELNYK
jgi:hypothetical protein